MTSEDLAPADCLIIRSSSESCYLETSNLDGEDNLKVKFSIPEISGFFTGENALNAIRALHYLDDGLVKTEQPNNSLHSFTGSLKLKSNPKKISIGIENMILRGSRIKNSE